MKLLLFDLDGTILHARHTPGQVPFDLAMRDTFEVDVELARMRPDGKTDPAIVAEMCAALAVVPGETEAFARAYLDALSAEMARPDRRRRILPGVEALLEALSLRPHVHLGLVTGNVEAGARAKLAPFGLNPCFPTGGFGSDHPDRREVARRAAARVALHAGIPVESSRVVVVGDTELDVDCARFNGFRAVAVLTGWATEAALRAAGPDVLLSDLGDLADALEALGLA